MKVLFDLGLTVDDIKNMLEINPYIPNLDAELIDILKVAVIIYVFILRLPKILK